MDAIWWALWAFLPAGLANASPVVANRLPLLKDIKSPLDLGVTYKGRRLLGDNKTWRGLLFGVLIGGLTGYLQLVLFDYGGLGPGGFVGGALLGLGALLGDALESFLKRQMHIPAGQSWFPFDQLDYIGGGLIVIWLAGAALSLREVIMIFIVWFAVHVLTVYVFFLLNVRDEPI
jgi:CDP-2,3-bis-(O-geranylgeranyl)-sn-glycerol synthase